MTWFWAGLDAHPFELGSTIIIWSENACNIITTCRFIFSDNLTLEISMKGLKLAQGVDVWAL